MRFKARKCLLIIMVTFFFFLLIFMLSLTKSELRGKFYPHIANDEVYEIQIRNDLDKQWKGFGDNGSSVQLFGDEKLIGDEQYKELAINELLSEHIGYNRIVPDTRNPFCKEIQYDVDSLPSASVVIIFLNESYSVLLRTVHSLINTGSRNLKEIILVDDGNTEEILKGKLDYYIKTRLHNIVKIVRLPKRVGLIKARLAGARLATSDILVFMDAHSECETDWLQPLSQAIKEDRTKVVMPITETIVSDDFRFLSAGDQISIGGFSFNGHFMWIPPSPEEQARRLRVCGDRKDICPYITPTMVGGYFAMDRKYFWEMGSYDEGMEGWGGENLEMSFRIWMCGGSIEALPCSRIGHMVRRFHPYKLNTDTLGVNSVRSFEVWLDEYKKQFYIYRPDLKNCTVDVSDRKALRRKLQCKSFDWYLRNIYPQKYIPVKDDQAYGRLENKNSGLCIDDLHEYHVDDVKIAVYTCYRPSLAKSQLIFFSKQDFLRYEFYCLTVLPSSNSSDRNTIVLKSQCNNDDYKWEMTEDHQFRHLKTSLCLDCEGLSSLDFVYASKCQYGKVSQQWFFSI